jgi:serine/threonine-protein phosphatase 2A activator
MRKLQFTYWLEPAGSHGVWGLDDYQFLPFLFGSSQLTNHKYLRPKSIHDSDMVDELEKDYMYFSCIKHINSVSICFFILISIRSNLLPLDGILLC